MRRFFAKRIHLWLPLAILLAAVGLRASEPWLVQQVRFWVFDAYNRVKPRPYDAAAPVRIVDIDEESLARLGQWPWPRIKLAELTDRLGALGASVIAFDVVFAEPDRTSPASLARMWPQTPQYREMRARLQGLPDHDAVFAAALARGHVVTGFVLTDSGGPRPPAAKGGFAFAGDDPRPFVPAYRGAVVNLPALEAAAEGSGSLTGLPERDGVIRRAPLMLRMGDELLPSLGAEALRVAQGEQTFVIKASGASGVESFGESTGISRVKIGQFVVPTDENGRVWIYYSGFQPERFIPAWKIFEPDFDPALVEGRVLFVGTSAAGLKDLRITPLDPAAAGVEIYVELLEQIFSGEYLSRPDFALGVEVVYLLGIGLVLIVLLPRVGARWCGALGIAAVGFAVGASWIAFDRWRWLFDPVYPSLVIVAVYVVETGLIFLRTESERRWVRGAFARYISPAVVNRLAEHPERLTLGGEMRDMTILFCDIRDFTARSEKLDAHGLTRFINRYLTPMSEVVLAHQGTIDKYIGDCIMAFWNAPLDDPAHARNACRTAAAMRAELARLNALWAGEAGAAGQLFDPVRVGIGVNTGMCCVGNMGSDQRFDYSVLGDDVNLASRLEGQSKIYGVDIVISETTRAAAPDEPALELDLIRVKGKTKPVRVFTLLGAAEAEALAVPHAAMLAAYRARDWGAAEAALALCRAAAPSSLAALHALYAGRISACRAAPPQADWDGVYTAAEK